MADGDSNRENAPKEKTNTPGNIFYRGLSRFVGAVKQPFSNSLNAFWNRRTALLNPRGLRHNEPILIAIDRLTNAYDQENDPFKKLQILREIDGIAAKWLTKSEGLRENAITQLRQETRKQARAILQASETVKASLDQTENSFAQFTMLEQVYQYYEKWFTAQELNENTAFQEIPRILNSLKQGNRKIQQEFEKGFYDYIQNKVIENQYYEAASDGVDYKVEEIRQKITAIHQKNIDSNQMLHEESQEVFGLLSHLLINNKVHFVENTQVLAEVYLKMEAVDPQQPIPQDALDAKIREIETNKSKGFTDRKTGHIYVIKNNDDLHHDLLHETVHLISGPNGNTKILEEQKTTINEGMTEYFTKQYLPNMPVQIKNSENAYPTTARFIEVLAEKYGPDCIREAYFGNQGIESLAKNIALISEGTISEDSIKSILNSFSQKERIATQFTTLKRKLGEDAAIYVFQPDKKMLASIEKTEGSANRKTRAPIAHELNEQEKKGEQYLKKYTKKHGTDISGGMLNGMFASLAGIKKLRKNSEEKPKHKTGEAVETTSANSRERATKKRANRKNSTSSTNSRSSRRW